ncbi:MAG: AAA family ATPase [Bacilli bacterium]
MKSNKKTTGGTSLADLANSLPNYFSDTTIVKSGIYSLDYLLKGGLQLGSFIQFVAESGIGKSTIALQVASNLCEQGHKVLYLDSEGSVTNKTLESTGVSKYLNNGFYYVRESTFDKVEKKLDRFISTNEISVIMIDSIANLINEGFTNLNDGISITNNNTNNISGPLVKFINKYKSVATSCNICFVLVNQYRNTINMKIGTQLKEYGSKNVRYASDVIIKINGIKSFGSARDFKNLTNSADAGIALELEIVKSNKSRPGTIMPAYLIYGKGIDNMWNWVYELKKADVIKQAGKYFSLDYVGNQIKEDGMPNFVRALESTEFSVDDFTNLMPVGDDFDGEFTLEFSTSADDGGEL